MRSDKKKKYKINYARLSVCILIAIAIIGALVFGIKALANKKTAAKEETQEEERVTKVCEHLLEDGTSALQNGKCSLCGEQVKEPDERLSWPNTTTSKDAYPLQTADDDILVLVNKEYHMSSSYKADDMVSVEHCDPNVGTKETRQMRALAAEAFEELHQGALEDGYDIIMRTGYRSYSYQESLFASYAKNHGEEEANKYSARAGQSEHQTGWCCDVGVLGRGLTSFNGSAEADWIAQNCWKYGFIVRYLADKTDITGYNYESWHIRYVGKEAAKIIYEHGWCLEEYLQEIEAAEQEAESN